MIKRDFSHTWKTPTGLEVKADIPPYVWMYNRGTIDIDVSDALISSSVGMRHGATWSMICDSICLELGITA